MFPSTSTLPVTDFARPSDDIEVEYHARVLAGENLTDFSTYTDVDYNPEAFHQSLAQVYHECLTGETQRVMLFGPPQHGKSKASSINLPAFWLGHKPKKPVIIASYGNILAKSHSTGAKDLVRSPAWANIFDDTLEKLLKPRIQKWWTPEQIQAEKNRIQKRIANRIWFAGVGGPISGFGAGLGIIDDPIKNFEEANSRTYREKVWQWYTGVFRDRIWEGGVIILMVTRWHDDDLAGRILNSAEEHNKKWKVLHYPAIATSQEERDKYYEKYYTPMVGVPDPLGRQPGEPLAPGRYSLEALEDLRTDVGTRAWISKFQGMPRPLDGQRVKIDWLHYVDDYPREGMKYYRYWDKAASEDESAAWTAGVLMGVISDKNRKTRYIIDVIRGHWTPFRREEIIKNTCELDNSKYGSVETWIEQEGGSGGKESALSTIGNLDGYHIRRDLPKGSKESRFEPFVVQLEAGNIFIVKAPWNRDYTDELLAFAPGAAFKDQVDASSGGFKVSKSIGWAKSG